MQWSSIDFDRQLTTIEGANAINRQTRHVPLNDEALSLLRKWRKQAGEMARIFYVTLVKTAWSAFLKHAGIIGFRCHDMRHHFASCLVLRGVLLNNVRDLPGHARCRSRCATRTWHMAADHRREAVAKLNGKPILALTLRLPWNSLQPWST